MDTQKAIELNRKIIRIVTIIGIVLTIILGWLVAKNDYFAIDGPFRESIAHSGWVGILIFILIQITQVVYPIIPGGLTCVIGHIVFGPLYGWIYNFVGIMIGSCINFWLARRYGETLAKAFVMMIRTINTSVIWTKENTSSASSLVHWFFLDSQMISYVWWQGSVI